MLRILYSDIRKTILSQAFQGCMVANASYQLLTVIVMKVITEVFFHMNMAADDVAFCFATIAIFLVTASTLITVSEFADGTMRNKLISGAKRSEVFFSGLFTGMLQGFLLAASAFLLSTVCSLLLTTGFEGFTVSEMADFWIVITISCMAIGAFSTALIFCFGGAKISYVIGLAIAFGMKVFSMYLQDQLYPESGKCLLKGAKLVSFRFIDRFVPYSYLSMRPHWDFGSYFAGTIGLVAISAVIGAAVFQRKELL
ncbi:MAG: ABC transporter permease [Lachnospiraceae bacterium]|nr:ABC transporter permease [Lachnospiraceae bacterium]